MMINSAVAPGAASKEKYVDLIHLLTPSKPPFYYTDSFMDALSLSLCVHTGTRGSCSCPAASFQDFFMMSNSLSLIINGLRLSLS